MVSTTELIGIYRVSIAVLLVINKVIITVLLGIRYTAPGGVVALGRPDEISDLISL